MSYTIEPYMVPSSLLIILLGAQGVTTTPTANGSTCSAGAFEDIFLSLVKWESEYEIELMELDEVPGSRIVSKSHDDDWKSFAMLQWSIIQMCVYYFIDEIQNMELWMSGEPIVYIGLLFSFIADILPGAPRYNSAVLAFISITTGYFDNILPQMMIIILFTSSFVLDCVYWSSLPASIAAKALTGLIFVAKIVAVYLFLSHPSAAITKKILYRRLLEFGIPAKPPLRLNRDLRSRILNLGLIHLLGAIMYAAMFLMAISVLSNITTIATPVIGVTFWEFLLIKTISSLAVLGFILRDADLLLSAAHFGLLGCNMALVRRYTRNKEKLTNTFPVVYTLNEGRFNIMCGVKFLDFVWGIVGWITLSNLFGSNFNSARADVKAFCSVIGVVLAMTDIWSIVLIAYALQLFSTRAAVVMQGGGEYDSDDSEVFDLKLKTIDAGAAPARTAQQVEEGKKPMYRDDVADVEDMDDEDDDEYEEREHGEEGYESSSAPNSPVKPRRAFGGSGDRDGERMSVGASRDQFATTRQSGELARVTSFHSPTRQSFTESAAGRTSRDKEDIDVSRILIDSSSTVEAKIFSTEWNHIIEAQEINCGFALPSSINPDKVRSSDMAPFLKYLRASGLQIVAAGELVEKTSKIYACAVGRQRAVTRNSILSIHLLVEITVLITSRARMPYCSLECTIKCSEAAFAQDFLNELQLEKKLNNFRLGS